jgi:hypothetical protein
MNSLTIQTKLDANLFNIKNVEEFIGKDVIITIVEVPKKVENIKRKWEFIGKADLNHQFDGKNIRDFAYD